MDGKLLKTARDTLAEIKQQNTMESQRRRREIYDRSPMVQQYDRRLRQIMVELFGSAMGSGKDVHELERESLELQERRSQLLTAMGYSANYLDEIVRCPVCRDSGYVMGKMCDCLKAEYDRAAARQLSDLVMMSGERFENFDLSYYDDGINACTGISPRKCMTMVLATCMTYAQHFAPGSINLLLRGGPGLGKTYLSACIARVVSEKGFSVVYESAGDAFEAFEEKRFSRLDDGDAAAKVDRMLTADLLILDDLGTEMPGNLANAALYSLLNKRISAGKSTIISTNLSEDELHRRYTPQIASRIEGEFEPLEFCGRDIRAIKKERGM